MIFRFCYRSQLIETPSSFVSDWLTNATVVEALAEGQVSFKGSYLEFSVGWDGESRDELDCLGNPPTQKR